MELVVLQSEQRGAHGQGDGEEEEGPGEERVCLAEMVGERRNWKKEEKLVCKKSKAMVQEHHVRLSRSRDPIKPTRKQTIGITA